MASNIDFVVKHGLQVSTNLVVGTYTLNNVPIINGAIISGNVGIGTFNPTSPLHVYGNIKVTNTATISGITFSDGTFQNTAATAAGGTSVTVTDDTTTNANRYITFTSATSGTLSTLNTSSTKLIYNPLLATITLSGGNLVVSNSSQAGNISVTNATASTSTTTGALTVQGGAGIAGSMFAGGTVQGANVNVTGATPPTNGLYLPTANTLGFVTNSTETMRINSNGNVGIGVTNPLATLHSGNSLTDANLTFSTVGAIITSKVTNQRSAQSNVLVLSRSGQSGIVYAGLAMFDMSAWASDSVWARTQLDIKLSNTLANDLTNVISFRSDGRVGIGTTAPAQTLDVTGTAAISSNLTVGGIIFGVANTAINASNIVVTSTATNATFYPAFVEATTGNIGVRVDSDLTYNPSANQLSLTGNAWIQNSGRFGNVSITNTTPSTGSTTGALTVAGGVGVDGNINVGGNLVVASNITLGTSGQSGGFHIRTLSGNSSWGAIYSTAVTPASGNYILSGGGVAGGGSTYLNSVSGSVFLDIAGSEKLQATSTQIIALPTTVSTSTSSGALVSQGGLGVAGNIFAGRIATINSGQFGNIGINNTTVSTSTTTGALIVAGGVGIAGNAYVGSNMFVNSNVGIGTTIPVSGYILTVNGGLAATTKSFVINHPTKPGMKLQYASLEGPENGVYIRGKLEDDNTIVLPDYWRHLVDPDTITVHLTPYGSAQSLYVKDISTESITIASTSWIKSIKCFYTVYAERKDVPKLTVEI